VLVEAIVTDRSGNYIRDLAPGEFHVLEDNTEQRVLSVSRGSPPAPAPASATHIALFFGRIPIGDQSYAREAAAKFVEANKAPNHLMAILNDLGTGGTKTIQGFTAESERLISAVKGMEASGVLSDPGAGVSGVMSSVYSDQSGLATAFDVRTQLQTLSGIARAMAPLPGRKAIVFLTPTINYDVQIRTDPGSVGAGIGGSAITPPVASGTHYVHPDDLAAAVDTCNRARVSIYLIDVRADQAPVQNQLAPLAASTGGAAVDNSRDAFEALRRIGQDQEEHYTIAYSPARPLEAGCRKVRVRVDRGGAVVRTRSDCCNIDPGDPLAGTQAGRDLEARASGTQAGNMPVLVQAPFFYAAENTARVHITAEIPTAALKFEKVKGRFHAAMHVLGIASTPEGKSGPRFSDTLEFSFQNKKDADLFKDRPYHYEKDLTMPAGRFDLRLVFSPDSQNFGRVEVPLAIEPWNGKEFALSGIALSRESRNTTAVHQTDSVFAPDHRMISRGLHFIPTGNGRFKKTDPAMLYVEIYDTLLQGPDPPKVTIQLVVLDRKSGTIRLDSGPLEMTNRILPGNPVVPIGLKVPIDKLDAGSYAVALKASDSAGNISVVRHAELVVE
jgi:VWFA-related protein